MMSSEESPEKPADEQKEKVVVEEKKEVAEKSEGAFSWYSSWGSSLLEQAKNKTYSTYELVKKDLGEFKDAVSSEAKTVASSTANVLYEQASSISHLVQDQPEEESSKQDDAKGDEKAEGDKKGEGKPEGGYSSIISSAKSWVNPSSAGKWAQSVAHSITKVLVIDNTTDGEEKFEIPITSECLEGSKGRLFAIQSDPGTYANEPEGAHELYDDWLETFRLEEKDAEISELLGKNAPIRTIYAQLVPSKVSNAVFWSRYFYKLHQFNLDEARRSSLIKRTLAVESEQGKEKNGWDDMDEDIYMEANTGDEEDNAAIDHILEEEFGRKTPVVEQPKKEIQAEEESITEQSKEKAEENVPESGKLETEVKEVVETEKKEEEEEVKATNANSDHDSWSVCSGKEETPSQEEEKEETPEPEVKPKKTEEGEDGWIDWDD